MQRIIVGIDQSTGASSAFGIAIYNPNTKLIIATYELWPSDKKPAWVRIAQISAQMKEILVGAYEAHGPLEVRAEGIVMRGRSGQIIAWAVGTIIANLPPFCTFTEVHNLILKRNITGNSKADKKEMGQALLKKMPQCVALIQNLIDTNSYDAIDAVCIAICTETMDD